MGFEKRVCVLKQVKKGFSADGGALSGAVYVERLGEELTVMPRLLGVAPVREGRYALALSVGGEIFVVELKGSSSLRIPKAPSLKDGFAALLVFLKGEAEAVAFGSCGLAETDYHTLLAAFSGKSRPAVPLPPTELPTFSPNNVPRAPMPPLPEEEPAEEPFREEGAYDDEAIAEADYYQGDGDDETAGGGNAAEEKDAREDAAHPFLFGAGSLTYYRSVRQKLEEAFRKFEKDERLLGVFPASEWVKADGVLLGVIYESGKPKYLCVAAEEGLPEEMKPHACFVPTTPFSDMVGLYVVFQSADTGEYVTVADL